nr:phosphoribosylaminoimidazolesuccinocarboxamide synthase [uncultured Methanobrevibacter sp.]
MSDNPLDSVKGMFNRNNKGNSQNKKNKNQQRVRARAKQRPNLKNKGQFANLNQKPLNNLNQNAVPQKPEELSEMDTVVMQRMREIENVVGKLVADIQYLDSKNPAVSSKMTKIMVEMVTNLWVMGNIAIKYQKQNQLSVVTGYLSKQEEKLTHILENPKYDSVRVNDNLNEVKICQKIINDSLRPINSTVEYYNVLLSKLSNWGFEIKDPIGQKYDAYMDIDVLAFEDENPNLKVPTITETKKPEIYFNGKKVLKAQVVVTRAGAEK